MALNINQFAMSTVQGQVDLEFNSSVVSAAVDSTQVVPLIAGQAVKIVDSASPLPKVVSLASSAEGAFGFVVRNLKDANFPANAKLEIAQDGTTMYMTAGAAIARGVAVEFDYANNRVIAAAGINPRIGYAYDKAAALGDLIRVVIRVPALGSAAVFNASFTATLAEINAGKIVIPGVVGKSIKVTNFIERVTGAFTTDTSVNLQSDTTSVIVEATAQASLTNGAVLVPASGGVTLGVGFGAALPAGEGLKVVNIGTAAAGGTSITWNVSYLLV